MPPRKLLFATTSVFYPDSSGGAEQSLLCLFRSLRRRGWQVELVCGRSLQSPALWREAAASLLRLEAPGLFLRDTLEQMTCWRGIRRFRAHPAYLRWFGERLAAYRPDLVLGYNNLSCPLLQRAAASGVPSFFIARSLANLFGVSRFVPEGVRLLANSPFTAAVGEAALRRPLEVVLPTIELDAYRAERRERRYITFVNPTPEKGIAVALAVARAMPEARFLFVSGKWGDRSYRDLNPERLPNVEVWRHQDDMRAVYAVTDVLLVPSQWLETFGRVVVEAQANGIPVVAADVGGLPFTLGDGGLLVEPKGHAPSYVAALRRLRDEELYRALSAKALANSRRPEFQAEAQVDRFVAIVERVLAAPPAAPAPAGDSGPSGGPLQAPAAPAGGRGLAGAAILVSVLQVSILLSVARGAPSKLLAGGLAALTIATAWRGLRRGAPRIDWLCVLLAAQATAFAAELASVTTPPSAERARLVALVSCYLALGCAGLLRATRLTGFAEAQLLSFSIAGTLFLGDALVARGIKNWRGSRWVGQSERHAYLGHVYRPHSDATSYYSDNPRGYFETREPGLSLWQLHTFEDAVARLELETRERHRLRVRIGSRDPGAPWLIQLMRPGMRVQSGRRYALSFAARSGSPTRIPYSVAAAHAPGQPLGLEGEAELGDEWRPFEVRFTAAGDAAEARLLFQVGAAKGEVELADVAVRRLPDGDSAWPEQPSFTVRYRFNALGCRGRDYEIPRPGRVSRILMLGDSYVMGMGVHEQDTVAARLDALLDERARARGHGTYEVVNCGHSGYSTRDERRFYETVGARYQAPTVVLGMVDNDDVSSLDEPETHRRAWFRRSFALTWMLPRRADFSASVEEVKRLNDACRRRGARLVVFLFRNLKLAGPWKALVSQVRTGLAGTGIPLLDVGDAILREHTSEALAVHATDSHPNEIGHRIAADELLRLLVRERLD